MRKFRLIKEYPNSPELGTILNAKLLEPSDENFYYAGYWFNPQSFTEFWEEIVEKEYEILSGTLNLLLGETKIHSVKRLSDGEIFTIGDNTTKGKIHEFNEREGFLEVCVGNQKTLLRTFNKAKQPLFTTEDGKEIFKGDSFWFADKHNFSEGKACDSDIRQTLKHFSTKEAAENYVVCNKPCLSFREVNETVKRAGFNFNNNIKIALKELVKSKL